MTKIEQAVKFMMDNQGLGKAEAITALMEVCQTYKSNASIYYAKAMVKLDPAYQPVKTERIKKDKPVKVAKVKAAKEPKITVSTVGEENRRIKAATSTTDIETIKAANLKRMKAVSEKYLPGQVAKYVEPNMPHPNFDDARKEVARIEAELDGQLTSVDKELEREQDYPTKLNREQMLGLIG